MSEDMAMGLQRYLIYLSGQYSVTGTPGVASLGGIGGSPLGTARNFEMVQKSRQRGTKTEMRIADPEKPQRVYTEEDVSDETYYELVETLAPGGGQGGQKPGGGSSGGAGAGDPPPGTIFRPEKLPENHPCNGIAISDLNFYASRLPTKDDRRSKNGMEHIIFGHVNPIHSKMAAKKSQFIMSISPSAPLVKEQSLIEVGQAVFYYGGTPKENPQNKNWVITARFPQIFDGGVVKFIIGVGPQKTGGQSVDEVTLVLKPDCKGVVTMHPGTSGASGVPVGNIPPSAVIRTGAVIFNKP